ncbi:hypothetical protein KKF34_10110 [Myxococcota bacterium]|nr:hypothetical protein [Myxococcota bacterium]MBU1379621.1 hypothetical protein [Myxococcota bacterium]MBU1497220.1 hypothetical protein [Myxococcota bacterium]
MTWTAIRWVWRLEGPLFIGMPPAGSLNRCRLYVPARALWGAVTAEISRNTSGEKFPEYKDIGNQIKAESRFTYLFPTEKQGNKFLPWLPEFDEMRGYQWFCQSRNLTDREFRCRMLDSRPGTAIDPDSDSAAEGTLRETECINPSWRKTDNQEKTSEMFLSGYVFLKNNGLIKQFEMIDTLFVGGDTRYGLGKISRLKWQELSRDFSVFEKTVHLDQEEPQIVSNIIWGHSFESKHPDMIGTKELSGGWDNGSQCEGKLTWAPGSSMTHPLAWSIDKNGFWICKD